MANFCVICGEALIEGECPNKCSFSVKRKNKIGNIFTDIISLGKRALISPVEAMENTADKNITVFATAFIVLGALVNGLMPITGFEKYFTQVGSLLTNLINGQFSADSSSYGMLFGQTFMLSLVQLFGVVLGIYIIGGLFFHGKQSFKKSLVIVGLAQVPVMVVTTIALITAYIHIALGAIFLFLSFTLATVIYYQGAKDFLQIDQRKIIYLIPFSYLVSLVFTIIFLTLFPY